MQEFISIAVLSAIVVIIAYVARRSQVVGLPPGVSPDNEPDSGSSDRIARERPHSTASD